MSSWLELRPPSQAKGAPALDVADGIMTSALESQAAEPAAAAAATIAGAGERRRWDERGSTSHTGGFDAAVIHLLPCCIEHDGSAPVEAFFRIRRETGDVAAEAVAPAPANAAAIAAPPSPAPPAALAAASRAEAAERGEPTTQMAAFRGRRLWGSTVRLPAGYRGVVLADVPSNAAGPSTSADAGPAEERAADELGRGNTDAARGGVMEDLKTLTMQNDIISAPGLTNPGPQGSSGDAGSSGGQRVRWREVASFEAVTYWQHDTKPRPHDRVPKCVGEWLAIAAEMHRPVTAEQMEQHQS